MRIFGLQEEARVPRERSCRYGENTQSLGKIENLSSKDHEYENQISQHKIQIDS